ncbi:disease resistance-like protein DSC1 [Carya illinoinensis]|nr:disease resistance-like protein DSC1 [Carya illinoinensis]
MRDSFIKELGNGFRPKNLGTLAFYNCKFFKIPDLSSTSNLKELSVEYCLRLFQVHDSVGSLENLSDLSFEGCSALQILPKSLKLRSLRKLRLGNCSSLVELPEIECITESLSRLDLGGTAIEELPLSIRNLIGLEHLVLSRCKNLMRLPNACTQLQHLREVCIGGCTNIAKKMRDDDGQSLLPIESTTTKDFILSSDEQLHESNFFPISSFFTMFTSVSTLHRLDLSGTEIVSLPLSIKGLVSLINLELHNCQKLKEILVLPPNIKEVDVSQCESLERFAEVSKVLQFNGSHIRSLQSVELSGCKKMHVNIWNDKVQNPLLWKGLYDFDATLLPENQIPDWLSYVHEFLDNEMVKGHDEEWEIDIEGPLYLEEISGIVLYVVVFFKDAWSWQGIIDNAKITIAGSNRVCQIQNGVELLNMDWLNIGGTGYDVWVGYSNLQSFDLKVLPNLLVQFDLRRCDPGRVPFYQSCRAKVVYKDERREKKKTKIEADIAKSPDQQQLN